MSPWPVSDPWSSLRTLTAARIALGRSGGSLPTVAQLAFQLAHAQARDAVYYEADFDRLAERLREAGLESRRVQTEARDRGEYLRYPDRGRALDGASRAALAAAPHSHDLALVIADGLSGLAVERHAVPVAVLVHQRLTASGWRLAPVVLVEQGRVAIGDEIGALLGAQLAAVLIGERPGLSSPDSLGAYLTFDPRPGRTDAERNCVSNIRPEGLPLPEAAERIGWLLSQARRRRVSGVHLKEERALPAR